MVFNQRRYFISHIVVIVKNKDDVKERKDVVIPNDVVNVGDIMWWAIYIPVVDFSFSLSRLCWIFPVDGDGQFILERKKRKEK